MQRVFVRGLVGGCLAVGAVWLVSGQSWPDMWSLLGVCLAAGTVRPVSARSLVDRQWLAAATPTAVQARLEQGASLTVQDEAGATRWANEERRTDARKAAGYAVYGGTAARYIPDPR